MTAVVAVQVVAVPTERSTMTAIVTAQGVTVRLVAGDQPWPQLQPSWFIQLNNFAATRFSRVLGCFSTINNVLGRTEMRTRERKECQSIRTVWDIFQDDRARVATCSLRKATARIKDNYAINTRHRDHKKLKRSQVPTPVLAGYTNCSSWF